jgi:MFS family permease
LIPNTFAKDYRDARWLFVPYVIRGIGDVLMATLRPLPIALLLQCIYGLNTSTGMVVFSSTVQVAVPDPVRGRVFTLLDVRWALMQLLPLAVAGLVVARVGIRPVFWGGGALLCVAGLPGLALFRHHDFHATESSASAETVQGHA